MAHQVIAIKLATQHFVLTRVCVSADQFAKCLALLRALSCMAQCLCKGLLNGNSWIVAAHVVAVAAACPPTTNHAYNDRKLTMPAGVQSPLSGSMTARGSPASGSMTARGTPRSLRTEPAGFGYGNNSPSGSITARGSSFNSTPPAGSTTMRGHHSLHSSTLACNRGCRRSASSSIRAAHTFLLWVLILS